MSEVLLPKLFNFDGRQFVEFRGANGHPFMVLCSSIIGIGTDELGRAFVVAPHSLSGSTLHEYDEVIKALDIKQ